MRKINTILSVLLLVIFMLHGLMGSFMLLGIGSSAGKILAWVGVAVLAAHTVIGVILTINTLKISKNAGNSYLKQNAVFWARRASGLAILILMFFHIGLFGGVQDGIYILFPFTTVKLITQLLLVAALFIHLFIMFNNLTFIIVVIVNTVIGILQELNSKRVLDNLAVLTAPHSNVIRDGKLQRVETESLVKGDKCRCGGCRR